MSMAQAMSMGSSDTQKPVHIVLLFLPGNPGLSGYYDSFFDFIESKLHGRASTSSSRDSAKPDGHARPGRLLDGITILTTNQLGFTSAHPSKHAIRQPSYIEPSSAWPFGALGFPATEAVSLEAQVVHKLDLCADVLEPTVRQLRARDGGRVEVKVMVVGHSVGAYMCLPLLARYGIADVDSDTTTRSQTGREDSADGTQRRSKSPGSSSTSPASSSSTLVTPTTDHAGCAKSARSSAGRAAEGGLVIDRAYLLTPTVMHIARSRNGAAARRLRFLPWVSVTLVCIACGVLYLLERLFRLYGAISRLARSDAPPLASSPTTAAGAASNHSGGTAINDSDIGQDRRSRASDGRYRSPLHNLVRRMTTMETSHSIATTLDDLVTSPRNAYAALWLGRSEMVGIGEDLDISTYLPPANPSRSGSDDYLSGDAIGVAEDMKTAKAAATATTRAPLEKYAFWRRFGGRCRALWSIGTDGLSARADGKLRLDAASSASVHGSIGNDDEVARSGATQTVSDIAERAVAAVVDEDAWVDPETRLRLCRSIAPPSMLEGSIESRTIKHAWCTHESETRMVADTVVDWLIEDCLR